MRRLFLAVLAAFALHAPAAAQLPDRFTNLKVLPENIARDSLLTIMRGFSFALGVRCVHCHEGEDTPTLAGVNFASDARVPKQKAREMLRLVTDINQRLGSLPDHGPESLQVRCVTCHRGTRRPITLEDSLYRVIAARGGTAGVVEYDTLRARHYGRAVYDFGPGTLVRLGERLRADKRPAEAALMLQKNIEFFPRAWNSYYELGLALEALDRKEEALAAYRAVLERLPGHQGSQARIRALGGS